MDLKSIRTSPLVGGGSTRNKSVAKTRVPDFNVKTGDANHPLGRPRRSKSIATLPTRVNKVQFDLGVARQPQLKPSYEGTPRDFRSDLGNEVEAFQTTEVLRGALSTPSSALHDVTQSTGKEVGQQLTDELARMLDLATAKQYKKYLAVNEEVNEAAGIGKSKADILDAASSKQEFEGLRAQPIVALGTQLSAKVADKLIEQLANSGASTQDALRTIHENRKANGQYVAPGTRSQQLVKGQQKGELVETSLRAEETKYKWCKVLDLSYEEADALYALTEECGKQVAMEHAMNDNTLAQLKTAAKDNGQLLSIVNNLYDMAARKIAHQLAEKVIPQIAAYKGDTIVKRRASEGFKPVIARNEQRRFVARDPNLFKERFKQKFKLADPGHSTQTQDELAPRGMHTVPQKHGVRRVNNMSVPPHDTDAPAHVRNTQDDLEGDR